jgi:hypothetical protein
MIAYRFRWDVIPILLDFRVEPDTERQPAAPSTR